MKTQDCAPEHQKKMKTWEIIINHNCLFNCFVVQKVKNSALLASVLSQECVCLYTQGTADDDDIYSAAIALKRIAALSR